MWIIYFVSVSYVCHHVYRLWFSFVIFFIRTSFFIEFDVGLFYDFPSLLELYMLFPTFMRSSSYETLVVFCSIFQITWEFPGSRHDLVTFTSLFPIFEPLPLYVEYFRCRFVVLFLLSQSID